MQADLHDPLILQFASKRPDELAGFLAHRKLVDLSDFFTRLPVTVAPAVAARLPSWQLTSLLGALEPEFIGSMLARAPIDEAVAIVSHLHESRYRALLESCPPQHQKRLKKLIEFPSHSLAALVSTRFIRVVSSTSCGQFCEELAERKSTSRQPVLVVDGKGKYVGLLSLHAVISRRNRAKTVAEVADPTEPLNGLTNATMALTSRLWTRHTELPVVDEQHRVLGVVSRAGLLRVVGDGAPKEYTLERLFSEMALGYLDSCSRLLESILGKSR